ncbi:hypothetical protein D3870_06015 [Noviherbaspirillum cavernae]|uniref:OmpR/PhoB-type domain-containing protein n=1 Tax=Noviherbaspirillum cavernae TaxID=2320862 RepID=A0A418WZW1_9BURK|nr:winged helix-turn-helix domain-containing protein [Noviherbaspirillum cavernae]RJG05633.1 hypothetical protein D3870_06015 [Noviherbaspirillum cavernae]
MAFHQPDGVAPDYAASGLRAGEDGCVYYGLQALALPPKEQAVLHLLLTRSPLSVSKDDFAEQVWGGRSMSDESLTRCIHKIRHLLRTLPGAGNVTSLYGRGYRLTAVSAASTPNQRLLSAAQAPSPISEAFLYARHLTLQRTPAALAQAEQILRTTIAAAPDYAAARIALAECLGGGSSWGVNPQPELLEEGLQHLDAAERLAPVTVGLNSARAALLDRAWRFREAEAACMRALRDNPDDADSNFHYGWHLLAVGRSEDARTALRAAVQLHPYAVLMRITLARAHAHAGYPDEALREAEATCALAPDNEMAELYLTALQAWRQPTAEVVESAWKLALSRQALTLAPAILSYALARTGDTEGALDVIGICTRCGAGNACTNAMHAASLLALGRADDAMVLLQAAAVARCSLLPIALHDPANAALKQHPAWPALLSAIFGSQA